jgi:hypothetical protein
MHHTKNEAMNGENECLADLFHTREVQRQVILNDVFVVFYSLSSTHFVITAINMNVLNS